MCMWRSGLPSWPTRPTSGSRWPSRLWCGRCAAVRVSPLLTDPPVLRVDGDLLYLDRYWLEEQQVCNDINAMVTAKPVELSPDIDRLFPKGFEEQRAAAEIALSQ